MSRDTFTDRSRWNPSGLSMTAQEWREYFAWEEEQKRIHGSRFKCGERCFLRDPFKKEEA